MDHRADRVQRELERRDHAEVAAAAAQRPEQIGVLLLRCTNDARVGGHHLGGDQVVARQAGDRREPADAATEREAGDAGVADEAAGRCQAVLLRGRVDIGPGGTAAADRAPRDRIDGHAVHRAEMDHHPALADRVARVVVSAAAHRELEALRAREADRFGDLVGGVAARDERRLAIDGAVPDRTRAVVLRLTGRQHLPAETAAERLDASNSWIGHGTPPVQTRSVGEECRSLHPEAGESSRSGEQPLCSDCCR